MNTNLASLSDLNKSQRDGVAKAVMQTCSLWQVSLSVPVTCASIQHIDVPVCQSQEGPARACNPGL